MGPVRSVGISETRHIAMYLCCTDLKLSYEDIAVLFNRKEHSSVIHAVKKIERQIAIGNEGPGVAVVDYP